MSLAMRPPSASIASILEIIRADLKLSHTAAGFLTALPVAAMALVPLLVSMSTARIDSRRAILAGAIVLCIGVFSFYVGTRLILFLAVGLTGLGVAWIQVLLPAFIKERFEAPAPVVALYSTLSTSGAGVALMTTPLIVLAFGEWRPALASWGVFMLTALCTWLLVPSAGLLPQLESSHQDNGSFWRQMRAWQIACFAGGSSILFWSMTSWTPAILFERGWSSTNAGFLMGVASVVQIASSAFVTATASNLHLRQLAAIVSSTMAMAGTVGIALLPIAATVPSLVFISIGIGALFPLAMMLPVLYTRDPRSTRQLTAMTLCAGYAVAVPGPILIGTLRDVTGSYKPSLLVIALSMLGLVILARQLFSGKGLAYRVAN